MEAPYEDGSGVNGNNKKFVIAGIAIIVFLAIGAYFFFPNLFFDASVEITVEEELQLQNQVVNIVSALDFSGCDSVENELYRTVCVNNIALQLAEKNLDVSYCQKIDDTLILISDCERKVVFKKSIDTENIAVCGEAQNQSVQETCKNSFYSNLAKKKDDVSICNQIQDKLGADACYNSYIIYTVGTEDLDCLLLKGEEAQLECARQKDTPVFRDTTTPSNTDEWVEDE